MSSVKCTEKKRVFAGQGEKIMSDDLGRRLFSFGVITDTHLNQGEDNCNSPFEVNMAISGRFERCVRESALPPKADITSGKFQRSLKADIGCLLCPQERT
jgi:hypothetical protein